MAGGNVSELVKDDTSSNLIGSQPIVAHKSNWVQQKMRENKFAILIPVLRSEN